MKLHNDFDSFLRLLAELEMRQSRRAHSFRLASDLINTFSRHVLKLSLREKGAESYWCNGFFDKTTCVSLVILLDTLTVINGLK